ncbi:hypothetical protein EKO04_001027 [Ascochyta lentis]|uniref:Uncharacterized protein n=1 Tax=Ascochyta lentis TaxID=205686 RepID=A0A8H7JEG4_9PLEO|nr:hypothetical protein EKO04_001027 [Ascochyta lentis]
MCVRTGQVCPGPLEGPLIVDMTAIAKKGTQERRSLKQVPQSPANSTLLGSANAHILLQAVNTEAFYRQFLAYFTTEGEGQGIQNRLTWLQRLPNIATDGTDKALVLALEATATAYSAIMSSDTALTQHALDLYGTALRANHSLLQRSCSKKDFTIHMVSTSVLLSFFEAMHTTTADGYRSHIYGAAKILELTGPGQCAHGVLCQLYYHVRTQMLFIQLASGENNVPVSAKKILHDTLRYKNPPTIQKLMSCIATLGHLYAVQYETEERDIYAYGLLEIQVNELWNEYGNMMGRTSSDATWLDNTQNGVMFSNAFTALTTAYFSSAHILLARLASNATDFADSMDHFQVVLHAATYLNICHDAVAYMRMATPLLLVAMHAKCHRQRKQVVDIFELWSSGSMRGISALALHAVHYEEERGP